MSNYLTTNTELKSVADKIRSKSGGTNDLVFPSGFVSEIGNIITGGGDVYYTSSTGLLYTPIMTIDVTLQQSNGLELGTLLGRYGNMPYLEELTIIGVMRNGAAGNILTNENQFSNTKFPLLKKVTIQPTETRNSSGNAYSTTDAKYNKIAASHYIFSYSNLKELTIGKIGGPYFAGGGYFRRYDENGNSTNSVGSTDGLTLKIYTDQYRQRGGFGYGTVAANTTVIEYDYLTGEELTP